MSLSGRSLLYVLQRVVPFVVFGIVGFVCLGMQFGNQPGVLSDRVLFDLAVAGEIRSHFTLGPDIDIPLAPTSHVLWQLLVGLVGIIVPNLVAAGMVLNAATALVVLWQSIRLAEKLLNHPALVMCAGVVVAVSIPVLGNLLNHGPALLGIALALTSVRMHMSGVSGDRAVLSFGAAVWLGLAMLVHVEFVVFWFAMVAHAVFLSTCNNPRFTTRQAVMQGLVGLTLFALILWPVVHRNVTTSGMAWPFDNHAPQLITASNGVVDLDGSAATVNDGGVVQAVLSTLFGAGKPTAVFLLFSLLGIVVLAVQYGVRERSRAFLLVGFLLVGVPLLYGLFSMRSGWLGAPAVLGTLYPLLVIVGLYAAFQVGLSIKPSAGKIVVILVAVLWTITSLFATTKHATLNRDALTASNQSRAAWEDWHSRHVRGEGRLRVATDRPGWMCYRDAGKVNIDLTGWSGPERISRCREVDGTINTRKFSKLLDGLDPSERPQAMVLWDENADIFARRLINERQGKVTSASEQGAVPAILILDW